MKLMLCLECGDVVQLRIEPRACFCGAARGRYHEDGVNVEQTEGSISLALHNGDLRTAVATFRKAPELWRPSFCFRAYINPLCESDVRYLSPDPLSPEES